MTSGQKGIDCAYLYAASTEHKETSMNDESIDAENRADEITD